MLTNLETPFCPNAATNEQHPLVYKLSSAWDTLTAESDEGIGVRELRRLDPSFSVEDWKRDIQELFLPEFMSAFLRVRKEKKRKEKTLLCCLLFSFVELSTKTHSRC